MKKIIFCISLTILLLATITTANALPVHNLNTGEDFATIQDAINAVNTINGHTITVDDGIYNESIITFKELQIQSTNNTPENCIISTPTAGTSVFEPYIQNCTLKSFTIENATTTPAIKILRRQNTTIDNCIFQNNSLYSIQAYGRDLTVKNCFFNDPQTSKNLYVSKITDAIIENNTFEINNTGTHEGIYVFACNNALFQNNTLKNGTTALYIKQPSTYNQIIENDIQWASYGIRIEGDTTNWNRYQNIVISKNQVHKNGNNIFILYVNNTTIANNEISGGGASVYGIRAKESNHIYIQNNTVNTPSTYSQYAIYHDTCNFSYVQDNTVNKAMYGVYFRVTDTFNATRNKILNCTYRSIFITISENGTIYNNLVATDTTGMATNCYEYGSPNVTFNITKTKGQNIIGGKYIAGNYWSDYNGTDYNNDGIGDTYLPYDSEGKIQSGGGDYQPLVLLTTTKSISNVTATEGQTWIKLAWDMDEKKGSEVFHNGLSLGSLYQSTYIISDIVPNQKHTFALSYDTTPSYGYPFEEEYVQIDEVSLMESFDQSLINLLALSFFFVTLSLIYPLFSIISIPMFFYGGITAINQSNESWIILTFFISGVFALLLLPINFKKGSYDKMYIH